MPLSPRVSRAIDLAIGERLDGPVFTAVSGARMDGHATSRIVRRGRPAGGDRQARHTPHPPPRVHHRCLRRWRPAPRRPRSRQTHRPTHHHALLPRPPISTSPPPTSPAPVADLRPEASRCDVTLGPVRRAPDHRFPSTVGLSHLEEEGPLAAAGLHELNEACSSSLAA